MDLCKKNCMIVSKEKHVLSPVIEYQSMFILYGTPLNKQAEDGGIHSTEGRVVQCFPCYLVLHEFIFLHAAILIKVLESEQFNRLKQSHF